MAEKSVIASISQAEERPFKTLQLPALRAVVSEPAPQKRRFFLLLFLSSSAEPQNRLTSALKGPAGLRPSPLSRRAHRPHTIRCLLGVRRCHPLRQSPTQPLTGGNVRLSRSRPWRSILAFCPFPVQLFGRRLLLFVSGNFKF